jgi:hypothetical protein
MSRITFDHIEPTTAELKSIRQEETYKTAEKIGLKNRYQKSEVS